MTDEISLPLAAALAKAENQPETAFHALAAAAQATIGAKLFTLLWVDTERQLASRIYSNMPDAYPVGGTKPIERNRWMDTVLGRHQTFVANDIDGIAEVFFDHELIRSLGCESVVNIPIVVAGNVLGAINCLDVAGHYTPERVGASEMLKLPGAACFLLHAIHSGQGGN